MIKPPDIAPLFASAEATPASAAKESEDDADDDDDDDEDEDDEVVPGLILPGSATCIAISGTVTAGHQFDSYRVPKAGDAVPKPTFSWQNTASFRIATAHDLASGLRVGTAFEMSMTPNTAQQPDTVTIEEATVSVGTMTFGLATSRFSFWTGDEFAFSTRLPSRNVGLIAWERDLTERWNVALSLEDPTLATTSSVPVLKGRVPDGVARLTYTEGNLTLHMAGALRDVPGRRPGSAAPASSARPMSCPSSAAPAASRRRSRARPMPPPISARRSTRRSSAKSSHPPIRRAASRPSCPPVANGPTSWRAMSMSAATTSPYRW